MAPFIEDRDHLADIDRISDPVERVEITHGDGEIGEEEDRSPQQTGPTKQTLRKKRQEAIFTTYRKKFEIDLGDKDVNPSNESSQAEHLESLRDLSAQQSTAKVIDSPREYQMELFERAKKQNTIAVLDTGSGKTLIAAMLLRHFVELEMEHRAQGKPKRIAIFLVEKVTLVFQQLNMIKTNLYHNADMLCGPMGCRLWEEATWKLYLEKNDILVCTADVLVHALMHSFVKIDGISLLVFDEAHHAKKNHGYARIIKEFYVHSPPEDRPHIFGMTASPVDVEGKSDPTDNAKDLEAMLHAKIATVPDLSLTGFVSRPEEQIVQYERLNATPLDTNLYQAMRARYWDLKDFEKLFTNAKLIQIELGNWCCDYYWSFAFSDREAKKALQKLEQPLGKRRIKKSRLQLDQEIKQLKDARQQLAGYDFGELSSGKEQLTSKVLQLHAYLKQHFERPTHTRCLVFVERKHTARLLRAIFDRIGGPNLMPGELIGTLDSLAGLHYSFRDQMSTLVRFKKGQLNCLFATSVAEEGLDVPECNLVVRFDLCRTMIQYVQSRGRARQRNSKFLHLVEEGNRSHESQLDDIRGSEEIVKKLCNALPKDRMLMGTQDDHVDIRDAHEVDYKTYTDKETGAKMTFHFSLTALQYYVDCMDYDEGEELQLIYTVLVRLGQYVAEVTLPDKAPLHSVTGKRYPRRKAAKMSAAFEACVKLRKMGELDGNFLPKSQRKRNNAYNSARLAQGMSSGAYEVQLKPLFWERERGSLTSQLFLTVIYLEGSWERPARPLGLLTRRRLPQLPSFPIYRLDGSPSNVVSMSLKKPLVVDDDFLSSVNNFTLRIFLDVFNKKFERNHSRMSYWLAPLVDSTVNPGLSSESPEGLLDRQLLKRVNEQESISWDGSKMDANILEDKFIVDPFSGGRRFFSKRVRDDMSMHDCIPSGCPPGPRDATSIIQYSSSMYKQSKARRAWQEGQPVFEATKIIHRLNVLASPEKLQQDALTTCFLCPEPLSISRLPPSVAAMGLLFPAIIHRFDSYLIALELCDTIRIRVEPALALEAITKDSENTEDHGDQPLNFQRGMGPNYERLEFIGDCFLKVATSLAVYIQKNQQEGDMHVERMLMLCNKNLFITAKDMGLPKYIRSKAFSRRHWYPEGLYLLEGKGAQQNYAPGKEKATSWGPQHATNGITKDANRRSESSASAKPSGPRASLQDKTVADVCEALIGAALTSHVETGYEELSAFDDAVMAVTQLVKHNGHENHAHQRWADYYAGYTTPEYLKSECSASELNKAESVQASHRYKFNYAKLLVTACTDPSLPRIYAGGPSYQRLEFLGDALLELACDLHLFQKFPDKDPQWMTEHKMAMVANQFQGALCVKMNLHRFIRHNSSALENNIRSYVEEIQEAETENKGSMDYWTLVKSPPKCLADLIESYVGAIFVDSNFNFAEVQRFFDEHIRAYFEDMAVYDAFANNHPIVKLRDFLERSMGCHAHRVMAQSTESPNHRTRCLAGVMVHDTIVSEAYGESSRYAKMRACHRANALLEGLVSVDFRGKFGCDCVAEDVGGGGEKTVLPKGMEGIGTAV